MNKQPKNKKSSSASAKASLIAWAVAASIWLARGALATPDRTNMLLGSIAGGVAMLNLGLAIGNYKSEKTDDNTNPDHTARKKSTLNNNSSDENSDIIFTDNRGNIIDGNNK